MFHTPSREFSVSNEIGARVGETVLIRLGTGRLARWSLTAYLIPVFAVLIGAALGASTAGESYSRDGGAICGSLVGLFFSLWLIASRLAPTAVGTGPRLVRLEDNNPSCRREDGS
jgi:positive regulator of sigma E activity